MVKLLPAELRSNIQAIRFMASVLAVLGCLSIIGLPWAAAYIVLVARLTTRRLPSHRLLVFGAIVTLPLCVFLLPIFLEVALWRLIKKLKLYETQGDKAFLSDKTWRQKSFFRRYDLAVDTVAILLLFALMLVPFSHTTSTLVDIPFAVQNTQDASLELGDTQTRQPGTNGQGMARQKVVKPVIAYLLGLSGAYSTASLPTQTTQAPINQIVAQGTKKYQYMWCSNGAYRYYTNDQFQDPHTGFTHKSVDYCAQNKQGHMTGLADTAPPQQTSRTVYTPSYTPSYTTCHDYSFMNEFSCTTY